MRIFGRTPPFDPQLTFPDEEQAFVRQEYARAGRILEYGSGGSTRLAADLGKPVIAVESDKGWARQMNALLAKRAPGAEAVVVYADIGPTVEWGKPATPEAMARYHRYPLQIWNRPGFQHPDLILIDGRFRVACFCASLLHITRPTRVLFDDYHGRASYAVVDRLVKPALKVGRMAVFDLVPGPIAPQEWTWIAGSFVDPR
jgi:hypothetical protein